jgi:carboxypeptidase family protein/TonB-dependent receptor-like protein
MSIAISAGAVSFSIPSRGAVSAAREFLEGEVMKFVGRLTGVFFLCSAIILLSSSLAAQGTGNASSINGTVTDPTGAVVPGATVTIDNPVSGFHGSTVSDSSGGFSFSNIPFNPYHLTVTTSGFAAYAQDVEVRSAVPVAVKVSLQLKGTTVTVTVEAASDLIENDPTDHTDIDRQLFDKLPLESMSSSVSSLVTLSSPGIAADSNGLFHGLGDHAENSFSVDGQPITDQQSKIFSNQIPVDSIQSLEVIDGAPPAEYGGKTSVVIDVTTRSGLGATTPHGEITVSYGTFGSTGVNANLAYGGQKWGNFISLGGLNSGRFLDPPEFQVLHDKGNEENAFDRLDYRFRSADSLQLNLGFTRSWFQNPNTWDQQLQTCTLLSADCNDAGTTVVSPVTGAALGPTDQRSQIRTFNVAPTWVHVLNSSTVYTLGTFVRHDQYDYYPSKNAFSDLGPLQDETVSQLRFLTNVGARTDVTYVKGIHNFKIGSTFEHTFLTEHDNFGIVNPGLLSGLGCPDSGNPVCAALAPYDLTAGGSLYHYRGHADIKEIAFYAQDSITKGSWVFNIGMRGDLYNGVRAVSRQPEPRAGIAYNIKSSGTVFRVSYARTMESPFNEDLILSGTGCENTVVNAIMVVAQGFACTSSPLAPGFRNEFHAGGEQAFGKHFVLSGEYIWKYTHNGYDFNVFGATPIFLPIEWHNSKIPGFAIRGNVPNFHGFTALVVMSHVSARFNPPTVAGIAPPAPPSWFRIDHDEKFNQTTHIQYQPWKRGPWVGFNWRYDSGLVAGFIPCEAQTATCSFSTSMNDPGGAGLADIPAGNIALVNNLNGFPLTADQEFEAGLRCNGVAATPTRLIGQQQIVGGQPTGPYYCAASQLTTNLISIPAPNTEQDDHNPQRIASRNLFDLAIGDDNLLGGDKYKVSARVSVINLGNNYVLYNFLSTFSGTHYVAPRSITAEIGFHF